MPPHEVVAYLKKINFLNVLNAFEKPLSFFLFLHRHIKYVRAIKHIIHSPCGKIEGCVGIYLDANIIFRPLFNKLQHLCLNYEYLKVTFYIV